MIYTVIIYMLISFLLAFTIAPWTRKLAVQKQIMDHPSEVKIHDEPIPRTGGIAIVIAFLITSSLFLVFILEAQILFLIAAGLIIIVTGIVDDIKGLSPIQKLAGQAIAALIFAFSWPHIGQFSPILGGVLSFFFILLVCNAVNLIDGLDGLAAGVSAIASMGFLVLGFIMGNTLVIGLSAILAGAALGFLPHNWSPAKIFMGDTGSLFLGFTLAATGIISIQKANYFFELFIPLIVLGIPLLDVGLTIARRIINRKPLFTADLAHSYSLIQKKGLTAKGVIVFYYGFGIILSVCGIIVEYTRQSNVPVFVVLALCALLVYLVTKLKLLAEE